MRAHKNTSLIQIRQLNQHIYLFLGYTNSKNFIECLNSSIHALILAIKPLFQNKNLLGEEIFSSLGAAFSLAIDLPSKLDSPGYLAFHP